MSDYIGRDLEVTSDLPNYYSWILEIFRPYLRGTTAEIGAGIGTFSKHIAPHVSALDLFEPSKHLFPRLEETFQDSKKTNVHGTTLENALADKDGHYDAIVMVNVLEHIEDDAAALGRLWRCLKPGGHLLLYVPALPFLYSRFDRSIGHYRRYTRKGLWNRLHTAGFQIDRNDYMDVLGILPWYVVNTLGGQTTLNPSAVKLYDRIGVPITKFLERYVPFPFGKNLVSVAQRPN